MVRNLLTEPLCLFVTLLRLDSCTLEFSFFAYHIFLPVNTAHLMHLRLLMMAQRLPLQVTVTVTRTPPTVMPALVTDSDMGATVC